MKSVFTRIRAGSMYGSTPSITLMAGLLLLLSGIFNVSLQAQTLVSYGNASTGVAATVNANLGATNLIRNPVLGGIGATLQCGGATQGFSGDGWFGPFGVPANGYFPNDYIYFTLTPATGISMNLQRIELKIRRQNTATDKGPDRMKIEIANTPGGAALQFSPDFQTGAGGCAATGAPVIWDFTDINNVTAPITFRIHAKYVNIIPNNNGDISLRDVIVYGTTSCTPPTQQTVTGGGSICAGLGGVPVGLAGSQSGINYQLRRNGVDIGLPVSGAANGGPITFGNQTLSGVYTVVAVASANCTATMSGSVTVNILPQPNAAVSPLSATVCQGGSTTLTASGGGTYAWSNSATTAAISVTPFANTTYTVVVTGNNGCTATATATVNVAAAIQIHSIFGTFPNCSTYSAVIELSGSQTGVNYTLRRNGNAVSTLPGTGSVLNFGNQTVAGTYTVTASTTGPNACTANMMGSVVITANNGLNISINGPSSLECGVQSTFDVVVNGFCSMTGVQFNINWNAARLRLDNVVSPSILGNAPLVTTNPVNNPNQLSFSWINNDPQPCDGNLVPGTVIMQLVVTPQGCNSSAVFDLSNGDAVNCFNNAVITTLTDLTVSIDDTTPPAFSGSLPPVNIPCAMDPGLFSTPRANDDCGNVTIDGVSNFVVTTPAIGTPYITWVFTDACGNSSTATQAVNFLDVTPPVFTNCPVIPFVSINTDFDRCDAVYQYPTLSVNDGSCPSSGVSIVRTTGPASGSIFPIGNTLVTHVATDASGNQSTCSFTVNVRDNQLPTIACPGNLVLTTTNNTCSRSIAASLLNPVATDNCPGLTLSYSISGTSSSSGTGLFGSAQTFGRGSYTLTWTATDVPSVGPPGFPNFPANTAVCSLTVVVNDAQAPSFTACPSNITLDITNSDPATCSKSYTYTVTATDNCGLTTNPSVTNFTESFPLGTTPRSFTAIDQSGNANTCSFSVTVQDKQAPMVSCSTSTSVTTSGGACSAVATFGPATGTDNCSSVTITQIGGLPSGASFPIGSNIITYRGIDTAGNSATCSFTISVSDGTPPVLNCPANGTVNILADAGCSIKVPNVASLGVTASDQCAVPVITQSPAAGTILASAHGTIHVVSVSASDGTSSSTCLVNITALDITAPTLTCPSSVTVSPAANTCEATVSGLTPVVSDNCSANPGIVYFATGASNLAGAGDVSGAVFASGVTTVTYSANDGLPAPNNVSQCSFTVTVLPCYGISGNVRRAHNFGSVAWASMPGVPTVTATLSGSASGSDLTGIGGGFVFNVAGPGTYTVTPSKNNDLTNWGSNGVDAGDVTRIQQHIGGLAPYPLNNRGAYQRIESDINGNGVIDLVDASLLAQSLANNSPAIAQWGGISWRFVQHNHTFTFPAVTPLSWVPSGFPTTRTHTLTAANSNVTNSHFRGMKIGDPEGTWSNPLRPEEQVNFAFTTRNQTLVEGTEIAVDFKAQPHQDLAALQMGLEFDGARLEFLGLETLDGAMALNEDHFGLAKVNRGEIRMVYSLAEGIAIESATPAFRLRFAVREGGVQLSDVLNINHEVLAGRSYDTDLVPGGVELVFTEAANTRTDASDAVSGKAELLQNQPNPFIAGTTIGFILPTGSDAALRIYDQTGRMVYEVNGQFPAGYNTVRINRDQLSGYGVYMYELITPTERLARKMVLTTEP